MIKIVHLKYTAIGSNEELLVSSHVYAKITPKHYCAAKPYDLRSLYDCHFTFIMVGKYNHQRHWYNISTLSRTLLLSAKLLPDCKHGHLIVRPSS